MKEPILGRPAPRPIQDIKDLVNGWPRRDRESAPMAPDVETVISPERALKAPKRKRR